MIAVTKCLGYGVLPVMEIQQLRYWSKVQTTNQMRQRLLHLITSSGKIETETPLDSSKHFSNTSNVRSREFNICTSNEPHIIHGDLNFETRQATYYWILT
ncbi:hypothetical protein DAI22_11g226250 [Oryza sativa Japonica Group]|nr:hypothetical protein DAI22_11g226250 [Oryza sativa Japonica Group]